MTVIEAGVDTWRLLFRGTRDYGPEIFKLGRYRAEWMPGLSTLCVEGHPLDAELCPGDQLEAAFEDVSALVHASLDVCEFRGISRLDSTVTHLFEDGRRGVAFLQGMAAMDWPRLKPVVWGKPPETVGLIAMNSRGRLLGRGYDTGLLRGTRARGEAIRLEDQRRFASGARPGRCALRGSYIRAKFEQRFVPLWRSAKGVRVASLPVLAKEVADRVKVGEMRVAQAERLIGFAVCETAGLSYARRTYYRRRAELRAHGFVVADAFFEPVEVDLGSVFETALESPSWG